MVRAQRMDNALCKIAAFTRPFRISLIMRSRLPPTSPSPLSVVRPAVCCEDIIALFNREFSLSHRTCLVKGGVEPEYIPAENSEALHHIVFTQDYVSSALHEVAHWCVAGEQRRLLADYGYWYAPDGRNAEQQAEFERVEVKPQALEWIFSVACGVMFRVSVDNLAANMSASEDFKHNILAQVHRYCEYKVSGNGVNENKKDESKNDDGLNDRSQRFIAVLSQSYQTSWSLSGDHYTLDCLS